MAIDRKYPISALAKSTPTAIGALAALCLAAGDSFCPFDPCDRRIVRPFG
ncbi:hypothetical protein [Sphingomonas bacterium]|nr:hypothetical protein [Sphingomonas bacterium]